VKARKKGGQLSSIGRQVPTLLSLHEPKGRVGELVAWRLDESRFAPTWDSGEGARLHGGRWNSRGRRIVYCSVDPSTAILEVAVHKGFKALDIAPHVLTAAIVAKPASVHIVRPADVPNANWLMPGYPSAGQQAFGDSLLSAYPFVGRPERHFHAWLEPALRCLDFQRHVRDAIAGTICPGSSPSFAGGVECWPTWHPKRGKRAVKHRPTDQKR
jgi:RES domain-containing protein